MARLVIGLTCFGIGIVASATAAHAQDAPDDEVLSAAHDANVDPTDLLGAMSSTGLGAREYLYAVHELARPYAPSAPAAHAASMRVKCIESKESGGANVANRQGSGAAGVMQYMPSTFASHAREMGHADWSPWVAWQAETVAEHDLALGRRSQWTVGGC